MRLEAEVGQAALKVATAADDVVMAAAAAAAAAVAVVVVVVVQRNEAGLRVRRVHPFVRKAEEHFRVRTCVPEAGGKSRSK